MVDTVFTIREAAELVKVAPETLRQAIRAGTLKAAKIGPREWRVSRVELQKWFESIGGGKLFEEATATRELALELWDNLSQQEIIELLAAGETKLKTGEEA